MATTFFIELSQQLKRVQQNSAACHCSGCFVLLRCIVDDAPLLLQNFLQSLCIPFTNNQKNLGLLRSLFNSSAQLSWFQLTGLGQNPVSHQCVGRSFALQKLVILQSSKRLRLFLLLVQSRSSEFVKPSTAAPKPTCEVVGIYNPRPQLRLPPTE